MGRRKKVKHTHSEWPSSKKNVKRRMVKRTNKITAPSGGMKRLGSMRSKVKCKRLVCGNRISKLAEKHGDPYCSRVCMALDSGFKIRSTKELLGEDFRKSVRRGP